jgi:hypothetical protein
MSARALIVGGVTIPQLAGLEISQSYEPIEAVARLRLASGALIQRTAWAGKLRTTLSGRGAIPAGLQGIDWTAAVTIECIAHRAISGAGTALVFTLPAGRRTDSGSLPYGRALVGRTWVPTSCAIATNVATLGAVSGAAQYQVVYFPKLTCFASPPTESREADGTLFGWDLTAEEI